jgi:hypothetical protein
MGEPNSRSEESEGPPLEEAVEQAFQEQSAIARAATNPLIKAVLGTAPFTGGLASLLSDAAQHRLEIRLRAFLITFARTVDALQDSVERSIDRDYVSSPEFAAVLQGILSESARSSDDLKQEFLSDFLLNASRHLRPDATWQDIFLGYVRQLAGIHLAILATVDAAQHEFSSSDRLGRVEIPPKVPLPLASLLVDLSGRVDRLSTTLLRVASADLVNLGLLVDWRTLHPASDTPVYDRFSITDNGLLFIRFLRGAWLSRPEADVVV